MDRTHLRAAIDTLAEMPAAERHRLPGISAARARQSLAGALIGHTAMKLMVLKAVAVCPWAIREGVLLRCIEDGPRWWDTTPDSTPAGPRRSLHLAHDVA
jgi:exopolyphosphatase/guanosine-5'-triphosphate,3'-diphosphate pyrophosphatase